MGISIPRSHGESAANSWSWIYIGVKTLRPAVHADEDWIPTAPGTALYIRPYIISDEVSFSVEPAKHYHFIIILCAVGAYYDINRGGLTGSHIYVEDEYIRAAVGGTGFAKCGGNYACAQRAANQAVADGYGDVLWLDGVERRFVEEVGGMNIMFKKGNTVMTPQIATGSVLPGITRKSIIELLKDWGYEVKEEHVAIADIMKAGHEGKLEEVFGTGTAAVVSPVKELDWKGDKVAISGGKIGELTQKLYDTLTGIQWGKIPDTKGWIVPVCKG